MKKHKQAAFSLAFGIDLTETTSATSDALQKIGEYPDGTEHTLSHHKRPSGKRFGKPNDN